MDIIPNLEEIRALGKLQKPTELFLDYGYPAHILDAIEIFNDGFDLLSWRSDFNYWKKSGLISRKHIREACTTYRIEASTELPENPGILAEIELMTERSANYHPFVPISEVETEKRLRELDHL